MRLFKFMRSQGCPLCMGLAMRMKGWNRLEVINIDFDDDEAQPLFDKFNIRNVPVLVLVDDNDKELKRWNNGELANIKNVDDYLDSLK